MDAPQPVPFIAQYAARKGLKYLPEADERWIRVWEPYATIKTPLRYEHVLESTGDAGSMTVARFVVDGEASAWIAIVQDPRLDARGAATSDLSRVFGDPLDLVALPRRMTGDPAFDRVFASFAATDADLSRAITPSLRKLTLGWKTAVHFEVRPGGFVLAPVVLPPTLDALSWLIKALPLFGEKAAKRPQNR